MSPRPSPTESDPFRRLVAIMERLLDADGCPWDREQTHETLKPYVIEEAYEVCEAVDEEDMDSLREELGDVMLQTVFHAALARREGHFAIDDVLNGICAKLIRRHPHVFADTEVSGSGEVLQNWEKIKQVEKEQKARARARRKKEHGVTADDTAAGGEDAPSPSALDGVPKALPALTRAFRVQEKAARVGFDWDQVGDVWKKVEEEVREVREALESGTVRDVEEEIGDFLFALVNLTRFLKVHPEESLQRTTNKFIRRFRHIEKRAREQNRQLSDMTLEQMDVLWEEAKRNEREKAC